MKTNVRTIFFYFTISSLFITTLSWFQGCKKQVKTETSPDVSRKLTDEDYAGTEACRSCHAREYNDWRNSHHDLAMMAADSLSVKANFNTTFISQGITNTFTKENGKYLVNTQGPDGAYHNYEVVYTFGVTPLQQYIVQFPNGRLQCLRTAWDTEKGRWFDLYPDMEILPDEWLHWSRGGLNWNTMCSDCHATNVHKNFSEETGSFNTTFSIINVSCEACHGPGRIHVKTAMAAGDTKYNVSQAPLFQVPAQSAREQVDQCARCHARRVQYTEAYNHQGKFMDHYVPEILRDQLYFPDGQIMDEDYVYGSFVQSKMYNNNVACTDCHNPHNLKLKLAGNALCGQCHTPARYDSPEHHFHTPGAEPAQCVSCHMPGRYYMGNDFRRDHSFRVPRPDLSVLYNTPNACTQCHTDKSAQWAADAVTKWYGPDRASHFSATLALASTRTPEAVGPLLELAADTGQPAIARATAIWYLDEIVPQEAVNAIIQSLKSDDDIVRHTAVQALADLPAFDRAKYIAPLLNDTIRTIRLAAAEAMAGLSKDQLKPEYHESFERGTQEYMKSLTWRADFPGGQFEKAQYFERNGWYQKAEQAYLKVLEYDDRFNAARLNLAYLYNRQGKNDRAIPLLKKIIDQEPHYAGAYYSLGLLYAEEKDMNKAIEYLLRAVDIEGAPRMYYNLGVAYQQTAQPEKAEQAYLKGLSKDTNNYDLMYAISTLYIQQKEFSKARPYVKKLADAFPDNPQLKQMMNRITENQ